MQRRDRAQLGDDGDAPVDTVAIKKGHLESRRGLTDNPSSLGSRGRQINYTYCVVHSPGRFEEVPTMSAFSSAERAYLTGERRLGRLATVGPEGTPHVTPVGFAYDPDTDSIDVGGRDLTTTKKFRDVKHAGRAAIVVDDLASVDPWRPRGVEVRGRAEAIENPVPVIRIHSERVVSWGLT